MVWDKDFPTARPERLRGKRLLILSWDGWSTLSRDSPRENILPDVISWPLLKLFFPLKRLLATHAYSADINYYSPKNFPPLGSLSKHNSFL